MNFLGFLSAAAPILGAGIGYLGSRSETKAAAGMSHEDRKFAQRTYHRDLQHTLGKYDYRRVGDRGTDMIGRERDLWQSGQQMQQAFDVGKANGLTPTEIAGSPVPGGTSTSGGGATLGNSQAAASANATALRNAAADRETTIRAEQIRAQAQLGTAAIQAGVNLSGQATQRRGQDVSMSQTQIQSATQQAVSKIAAAASIQSSSISAAAVRDAARMSLEASKYTADTNRLNVLGQLKLQGELNDAQIVEINAKIALANQKLAFDKVIFTERWQKQFAQMSADNVMASTMAYLIGMDIESVLKGVPGQDREALREFFQYVISMDSHAFRELIGIGKIATDNFGPGADAMPNNVPEPSLGSGPSRRRNRR